MSQGQFSDQTDYRKSHLESGSTYDATIAGTSFDAYMADAEQIKLRTIVPRLFPAGVARYLDFACGTARITQTVAPMAKEAIGVDISPSMLEQARAKCPDVRFVVADLTKERPPIGRFDLVTSFRFFGNAQPALRREVLRTLAELMNSGGYLIINNHRNPRALAAILGRLTGGQPEMDLTYWQLRRLLREAGFHLIESHPIGAWLYRARMLTQIGKLDERLLQREKLFGHPLFSPIAPDTIFVARRVP